MFNQKSHPMKNILLTAGIVALSASFSYNQVRFVGSDKEDFFTWFNQQSQVDRLYKNGTKLYIFGDQVNVHRSPSLRSPVLAVLANGHPVKNIAYPPEGNIPEGRIRGYSDIWYHVSGTGPEGKSFRGYIFGTCIAKGWRNADLDGDGNAETILLGVSSQPRKIVTDINAEIRILQGQKLKYQTTVPGLCVFEECGSSPLLRILKNHPREGMTVIETSTMTIGCMAGVERAFFYWNGQSLERVYHAEYTTNYEWVNCAFFAKRPGQGTAMICRYNGLDKENNPVWDCHNNQPTANARAK